MMKRNAIALIFAAALTFSACSTQPSAPTAQNSASISESSSQAESSISNGSAAPESPAEESTPAFDSPTTDKYIRGIVREHVAYIEQPDMSEYEKVKAAFDYFMERGIYIRPTALDAWLLRSAGE